MCPESVWIYTYINNCVQIRTAVTLMQEKFFEIPHCYPYKNIFL